MNPNTFPNQPSLPADPEQSAQSSQPPNDSPDPVSDVQSSTINSSPPDGAGAPPQLPVGPGSRKGVGGPATHKPGCKCRPCTARRRQEEAQFAGARPDSSLPAPIAPEDVLTDSEPTRPLKSRANVATWLKAKIADPGITVADIAKTLGISARTLQNQIYRGRRDGWLKFDDPIDEVRYGIVPKVIENMNLFLDTRDKQVTLEAFKTTVVPELARQDGHQQAPTTIFALKIELPEGFDTEKASEGIKGVIVGSPNRMDQESEAIDVDFTKVD